MWIEQRAERVEPQNSGLKGAVKKAKKVGARRTVDDNLTQLSVKQGTLVAASNKLNNKTVRGPIGSNTGGLAMAKQD